MKISAVNSYNNSAKYTVNNSIQAQQNFAGQTLLRKSNVMKALALTGMLAMATTMFESCTHPTGPDYYEPTTTEQPNTPTSPTGDTEAATSVQEMNIYKAFASLGIVPAAEKVIAPEGHYQPKTGDILEVGFTTLDSTGKLDYKYTLDTQNSKENDLKYKGTYHDNLYDEDAEFENSVVVNKEEKSISFTNYDSNKTRKFILNDDGTVTLKTVDKKGTQQQVQLTMDKETLALVRAKDGKQMFGRFILKLAE